MPTYLHLSPNTLLIVRCTNYFHNGAPSTLIAAGGSDGTIILWDLIAETGLFRLLGHSGGITDLSFISPENDHGHFFNGLISSSLDGLVKVWDLEGQCCTQTITSHRGDVTCSATSDLSKSSKDTANLKNRHRLATGCNDGQVRIWSVSASKRKDMEETKELITESSQESKVCCNHLFISHCLFSCFFKLFNFNVPSFQSF